MNKEVIKECNIHGYVPHSLTSEARTRCKKCMVDQVTRRRKELKLKAIRYKGGSCKLCGYNKCPAAMEFLHKDKATRKFAISKGGSTRSWDSIKVELDKCDMVCSNCSREIRYS